MLDCLQVSKWNRLRSSKHHLKWVLTACAIVVATLPITQAHADKEKSAYQQGKEQEARQNYEAAYEQYLRAYQAEPANLQYRAAFTRTRFLAAAAKVHRGVLLRQTGSLEEALKLLEAAAQIDPSSAIANQELESTRMMMQHSRLKGEQTLPQDDRTLSPDILDAQGPVKLSSVSNSPITLKLSEDTKMVYQTIAKLAGLNVLFDPDYAPRRLTTELNSVTLEQALDLVAAESKTFWRPMTANTKRPGTAQIHIFTMAAIRESIMALFGQLKAEVMLPLTPLSPESPSVIMPRSLSQPIPTKISRGR